MALFGILDERAILEMLSSGSFEPSTRRVMCEFAASAVADAASRGLLDRREVQSRLNGLPDWLREFQEPSGFAKFEERVGIVIPAAIKAFWREPALVCLLDAGADESYLEMSPEILVWRDVKYLTISFHGHSASFAAVPLNAGDDPSRYYGWPDGTEFETPAELLSPRFSAYVLDVTRSITIEKLDERLKSWFALCPPPEYGQSEPESACECVWILKGYGAYLTFSDTRGCFDQLEALCEQRFSDRQLEWVTKFHDFDSLEVLRIPGCGITDESCSSIARFARLIVLDLNLTKITDVGVKRLAGLTNLEIVNLSRTAVGDSAVSAIAGLSNLRILKLKRTAVTDLGISALSAAKQLDEIVLEGCQITDRSIPALAGFPMLTSVDLWNTQISAAGAQRLRDLRPEMFVEWGNTPVKTATDESE